MSVCTCAVVKSVFGYISACVHSVIRALRCNENSNKEALYLALTNAPVKTQCLRQSYHIFPFTGKGDL